MPSRARLIISQPILPLAGFRVGAHRRVQRGVTAKPPVHRHDVLFADAELACDGLYLVGTQVAVKRFDPDKGFRLATYAMWWIRASIQEYILRSWSLVKMGTTAAQKKLFFNLRRAKSQLQALDDGDLRPDQVQTIARKFGVSEQDVVSMNRRLGGDASLNAPVRADTEAGEWQDWLADDQPTQEDTLGEAQELGQRKNYLSNALASLNDRERRIFEARRLADQPGHARGSVERVRRVTRAHPANRGARLRKGAEGRAVGRSSRRRRALALSDGTDAMRRRRSIAAPLP